MRVLHAVQLLRQQHKLRGGVPEWLSQQLTSPVQLGGNRTHVNNLIPRGFSAA
jgi:hypothetical protein